MPKISSYRFTKPTPNKNKSAPMFKLPHANKDEVHALKHFLAMSVLYEHKMISPQQHSKYKNAAGLWGLISEIYVDDLQKCMEHLGGSVSG